MSEQTGVSREQIEEAMRRRHDLDQANPKPDFPIGIETWDQRVRHMDPMTWAMCYRGMERAAEALVPPGYKIVPADAVVISPEVARTAVEACETAQELYRVLSAGVPAVYTAGNLDDERSNFERFRAAAAALRGEG